MTEATCMWAVELSSRCRNVESSADRRSGFAMSVDCRCCGTPRQRLIANLRKAGLRDGVCERSRRTAESPCSRGCWTTPGSSSIGRPGAVRLKLSRGVAERCVMATVRPSIPARFGRADRITPTRWDSHAVGGLGFMRRVGAAMFVLGSPTLLATLTLPDPDPRDHHAIKIIAGLLALGAVAAWTGGAQRRWLVRFYGVYGILLVSALMAVARPIEATPFFYLWPMLFSAYFFTRREVAIDLAIMWVTLGAALFVWSVDSMK